MSPPTGPLTREPIDLTALLEGMSDPRFGALATFVGTVRRERSPRGQELAALEYRAYEPMARAELEAMCIEAARMADGAARVVHRLGVLRLGEVSVAMVVASPHRDQAFGACRWLIEAVKARAPIFKRQLWADGRASWVDGV